MELQCENCKNEKIILKGKYDIFIECQDCLKGCVKENSSCCIAPDLFFINLPRIDGKPTKRECCKNCWHVSGLIKMNPSNEWEKLPTVQRSYIDSMQKIRYEKRNKFYKYLIDKRQKFFDDQKEQRQFEYNLYLNTHEWSDRRIRVLNRDKYICQGCLINKATQVHHLTYDRIYKEPLFDLVSVCDDCHNSIHS